MEAPQRGGECYRVPTILPEACPPEMADRVLDRGEVRSEEEDEIEQRLNAMAWDTGEFLPSQGGIRI